MVDLAASQAAVTPSSPVIVLAERFAEFTRMLSIYPASNVRVQEALVSLTAQVHATCRSLPVEPEILFSGGTLVLDGAQLELKEGSALHWLEERVRKAALAGFRLSDTVSGPTLAAFATRLLLLYAQRDLKRSFESLWPDAYPGIELLDLRFDGYFDNVGATRRLGRLAKHGGAHRGGAEESVQQVATLLARHPAVQEQMGRLVDEAAEPEEGEEVRRVDVLSRIASLLPHDVLDDYEEAAGVATQILEELRYRLARCDGKVDLGTFADEAMLNQMVLSTSQGLLGSRAPSSEEIAERLARKAESANLDGGARPTSARASDDAIEDDLELLLEDLEGLPPPMTLTFTERNAESRPEQIGICLHFTQAGDHEESKAAATLLVQLLEDAAPSELAPLRDHLEATYAADPLAYEKLVELLRAHGLVALVRRCGFLVADRIALDFPRSFGTYLECLDPSRATDGDELARVCERVGRSRIEKAAEDLVELHGLLEADRVRHVLDTDYASVLPLLKVVLEHGGQRHIPEAVAALKRLRTDAEEACLLYIWDEPAGLPLTYLRALADPEVAARDLETLYPFIAAQICRYLRATMEREDLEERRVYAIHYLARFFTMEAGQLLQEILRARRYRLIPRETKAVREAARQVLTERQWRSPQGV